MTSTWTDLFGDAPVVRVPVQPFEVTDLRSLDALGDVMFGAATDDTTARPG